MTQRDTHEHENVFSYQRLWLANQKAKKNLRDDTRGVSPVLGVLMMIAVVALIAAFVAAVAYGVIGSVTVYSSGRRRCRRWHKTNVTVTISHYGGDTITDAFIKSPCTELGDKWGSLKLRRCKSHEQ